MSNEQGYITLMRITVLSGHIMGLYEGFLETKKCRCCSTQSPLNSGAQKEEKKNKVFLVSMTGRAFTLQTYIMLGSLHQ